jgi:3'-phosphoadenosine 5'-phosphosulfate sulfotransferase (PAPS reductase)/FAD synthetase
MIDPICIDDGQSDGPTVVAFSGGRTSAYMLKTILDEGHKPIVLFANTGKERDETLEFIHLCEINWGITVVWLEYTRIPTCPDYVSMLKTERMRSYASSQPGMHWWKRVDYYTAARHTDDNTPFDELLEWMSVLPNPRVRSCTKQLKIATMLRYLWAQGIREFRNAIGIRADEADRACDIVAANDRDTDVTFWFPLMEQGVTEHDVLDYWSAQPFDLQLQPYEGNCHLCFLKKRKVKQRLIREQPDLTAWWQKWEDRKQASSAVTGNGARWRIEKGHAIAELKADSANLLAQMEMFGSSMDCACTTGLIGSIDE